MRVWVSHKTIVIGMETGAAGVEFTALLSLSRPQPYQAYACSFAMLL